MALGLLLFLAISQFGSSAARPDRQVTVTDQDIARLGALWESQYSKPPTDEELDAIIDQHIREEILYREAMNMGLGQNDAIVRRRMVQKILFLSEELVDVESPTDQELQAYFAENRDRYRIAATTSFIHVLLQGRSRWRAGRFLRRRRPLTRLNKQRLERPGLEARR